MSQRRLTRALAAALLALAAACADSAITTPDATPGAPSLATAATAATAADLGPSLRWNAAARALVASRRMDTPMAGRLYALLSVAQHDAVEAADRVAPGAPRARHETSARAGVVAASATVLGALFPLDAVTIRDAAAADTIALLAAKADAGELRAAYAAGSGAARLVLRRAATDGSAATWTGTVPVGEGLWFSAATAAPVRPTWGSVRTWLLRSGDELRPAPPPAWGSPEYRAALAEVRRVADTRTAEQLRIALFWADLTGTAAPPGHWNAIAADLIASHNLSEEKATRVLALLNMAMMDAGIACWDAKYHYWMIRPSQADPGIRLALALPNFPSYPSGHATYSGAASTVLAAAFPSEAHALAAMAEEAAMSRLYAGIHYRFDDDAGLALGRKIGARAAERLR